MLLQTFVLLWISYGRLSLTEKCETCPDGNLTASCEFVWQNVCLEFVEESETWYQARSSCKERGGKLLNVLNSPIQMFLSNITREKNTSSFTWWVEKGVQAHHRDPSPSFKRLKTEKEEALKELCTYMKLSPPRLLTSDCSKRRGSLCTHTSRSPTNLKNAKTSSDVARRRTKRDFIDLDQMKGNINNITGLLENAEGFLTYMETTAGEPSDENRNKFISYLLGGTNKLDRNFAKDHPATIDSIIKCSNAILYLTIQKCDFDRNQNNQFFENVLELIKAASLLLVGETPTVSRTPLGSVITSAYKPEKLSNAVLGSKEDGGMVKLPSFSAMQSSIGKYDNVIAQMATFTVNPYPSANISGNVCNFMLSDGKSEIMLGNLSEMVEIFLPRLNNSSLTSTAIVLTKNTRSVSQINVSDTKMTILFNVEPSINVSLAVFLSYESPPNSTYFHNSTILSHSENYRWLITPEMLKNTSGAWYVEARLVNFTLEREVTLNISTYLTRCLYWHTKNEEWSDEGCRVGEKSSPELTQCLCNHLTLFGSSFFVMPNYVDVSRTAELFATVNQNYVVLALLCAFYGLYLMTLLWACYADRRASSKRKITLLEDNHPGTQYNYLIGVQTGHRRGAGTSANVTVKLIGTEADSTIHTLTDPEKPVFERGSFDMFLLSTPYPLGELKNIRLQHDNSGGHPSWYVSKVTIQDLQSKNVWHFFCNCWLSSDQGDGMTKKTFNSAKSNEIASFRNIFQSRTSTGFRDEHIWVSIVDPPSRSPFTRAQRVSCCMSLLLCTMAINIAFWNIPVDPNSAVVVSIGSLQMTWQDVMVGVQSGLLMFPINILIITIFRSIRPRIVSKSKKDDPDEIFKPPAVSISTVLNETEKIISLVSMNPRNKMSEVLKLEASYDLVPALDRLHVFIQHMQGESESDNHWVYCSKFLLAGLCHLLMNLEKLDAKNFSCPEEYQRVLNNTNLLVRKAEMVLSSHLSNCPVPVRKKKKTPTGVKLPWWCVFIGWFLLLSISGISTYFTLLYGFQYGKEKSIKWVMSLGLSLFESIFILQPLKVIGVAVFFALLLKPVAVEETEEAAQALLAQQDRCRRYTGRDVL
ncbi:polycystic kidney disease protein 1-like 2 [Xiphophorus hellerii]|uniref:polycystic kidney disease protein 1-like 2 n=1 Tax=Xiphophorus hellerii TaxID=8084 RepID=UPI0013B39C2B|nr:polycystic kidney disease protein 1-like 2 [Xiphophorus hellerii]